MKKSAKISIAILCVLWAVTFNGSLWAEDFGLILDNDAVASGLGNNSDLDYTGILIPRFSSPIGDNGGIFISAGASLQNNPWSFIPELLRTDFYWRFDNGEFRAGRMNYTDPLGFVADGLFDGARISLDTTAGTFSAGAWYTGLLYKKRANITISDRDLQSLNEDLDYSDFSNTYFAPRRLVAALDWEHPGLGELVRTNISLIGQYDLSKGDKIHSQYAMAKISVPVSDFVFTLGGSFELVETTDKDTGVGLAGELGAVWALPTKLDDQLSLLGRFSSGV
ncbi:MAG: hypothetical protein FWF26_02935, partial [Treponema sp.]|nr:hypothetical protein [Treponema sp.]